MKLSVEESYIKVSIEVSSDKGDSIESKEATAEEASKADDRKIRGRNDEGKKSELMDMESKSSVHEGKNEHRANSPSSKADDTVEEGKKEQKLEQKETSGTEGGGGAPFSTNGEAVSEAITADPGPRVGIIEMLSEALEKFGRSSPLFMESGCRALALLGRSRLYAKILASVGAEALAVDAISSVLEMKKKVDSDDEGTTEMVFVDGKLVEKEKEALPPRMRTSKLKKNAREARIAEEGLNLLFRLCYVTAAEREAIANAGGIAAICAVLKLAGANREIYEKCLLLIGMCAATSGDIRTELFESDIADLICAAMKRYGSDAKIALYGCWAIACCTFSHGSNQTAFALGGGLEAVRKARKKFKSKTKDDDIAVRAWSLEAEKAILGRKVNLECGWWKPHYEDEESTDYDSDAGLRLRPKVFCKKWLQEWVSESLEEWKERYLGAVGVQKIARGFLYVRRAIGEGGHARGARKRERKGRKGKKGARNHHHVAAAVGRVVEGIENKRVKTLGKRKVDRSPHRKKQGQRKKGVIAESEVLVVLKAQPKAVARQRRRRAARRALRRKRRPRRSRKRNDGPG